jgi:alcohol dehydrogenase class IV
MPVRDFADQSSFSSRSYEWRLHCSSEAIENFLKEEVIRTGAKRAFVICSPSIKSKTNSVERVQAALGPLFAGYFDGIHVEAPYPEVVEATNAAREAGTDLLISLGAGTIVVATRVINIYLCETGDHEALATQYPEGKPAYSPRLDAPKLPTINITTTPTGAMNRGGQGVASPHLNHNRLEYFDPKTRPVALIWDHEAILATPFRMMQGFATNSYVSAALNAARRSENPLVEADHEHIRKLARRAYDRMHESPDSIDWRIDLFVEALLGNRAADDSLRGAHMRQGLVFEGDLGLSTALHIRYPHVWQQDGNAAMRSTVIRSSRTAPADALEAIARQLDIRTEGRSTRETQEAIADEIERIYREEGIPARLRDLNIPREEFPQIAQDSVRIFNSNAGPRDEEKHTRDAIAMLQAAW